MFFFCLFCFTCPNERDCNLQTQEHKIENDNSNKNIDEKAGMGAEARNKVMPAYLWCLGCVLFYY